MFGDGDLAKIRAGFGWCWRTQCNVRWNNISSLVFRLSHGFFHNNLIQGTSEVDLNLIEDTGGLHLTTLFEVFRSGCHVQDSVDLFSVKLRKLLLWHVVNEEVIPNLRVGVNSLTMSLCDSLCKNSWVLGVEQDRKSVV